MLAQQQAETEKLALYCAAVDAARLAEWEFYDDYPSISPVSIFTVVYEIQSLAHRYASLNETHVGGAHLRPHKLIIYKAFI
ncbi:MAG: hypothetical protein V7K18_06410 [Nostoc sp.]|uniref:hypothetical protein n=1 Tax=Nostoc sp. TaxID=1180 RepID=UPI002FF50879